MIIPLMIPRIQDAKTHPNCQKSWARCDPSQSVSLFAFHPEQNGLLEYVSSCLEHARRSSLAAQACVTSRPHVSRALFRTGPRPLAQTARLDRSMALHKPSAHSGVFHSSCNCLAMASGELGEAASSERLRVRPRGKDLAKSDTTYIYQKDTCTPCLAHLSNPVNVVFRHSRLRSLDPLLLLSHLHVLTGAPGARSSSGWSDPRTIRDLDRRFEVGTRKVVLSLGRAHFGRGAWDGLNMGWVGSHLLFSSQDHQRDNPHIRRVRLKASPPTI